MSSRSGENPGPSGDGASASAVIHECVESDSVAWDSFVRSSDFGTFYHLWGWRHVNRDTLGHRSIHLAARDPAGTITGVLPLTLVSSPIFGCIICSMPFVNYGGPVAATSDVRQRLVSAAIAKANELSARHLELRCRDVIDLDLRTSLHKRFMILDLAPDPNELWDRFTSKHRTNIRRAYKNGLSVRSGGIELLGHFYEVMHISWHMLGTPLYGRTYFEKLLHTFQGNTKIFVCYLGERPVAAALNGQFCGMVEGMWAGALPVSRQLGANYVLYWEMIRDACLCGFTRFHLGRSTADAGGESFKLKWNAESRQLYWYMHMPRGRTRTDLSVDNPRFQLAIGVWRRLPMWATRLLGPAVARMIP